MASVAQVHFSHIAGNYHRVHPALHISTFQLPDRKPLFKSSLNFRFSSLKSKPFNPNILGEVQPLLCGVGGGGYVSDGGGNDGGSGGQGGGGGGGGKSDDSPQSDSFGPIGAFLSGWRSRVAADPQFPFKILMEELVGVSAAVLGDMATRPNFGLNELDFVISTLEGGSESVETRRRREDYLSDVITTHHFPSTTTIIHHHRDCGSTHMYGTQREKDGGSTQICGS